MPANFGKRSSFGTQTRTAYARPIPGLFSGPAACAAPVADLARPPRWPLFTIALTLVLCAIFATQVQLAGGTLTMGFPQAVSFGGVDRYLVVEQREWGRLLTAPWLHGSPDHLIGNLITLIVAGAILERHIGTAWLAAVYLVGGIGGSIGSMALGDPRMVSVGASGAIIALVTMVYALSYHASLADNAKKLRRLALFTLVPAIAPSAAHGAMLIDVGAHFGGFVVGLVFAFALLILWDEEAPLPGYRDFAACAILVAGAALIIAGVEVWGQYPVQAAHMAMLVPGSILDKEEAVARDGLELLQRFPHDPALRLVLGLNAFKAQRYGDAEVHARAGIAEREMLLAAYPRAVDDKLQALLALSLLGERRKADAVDAAQPVCGSEFKAVLIKTGLCSS